MRLIVILLVVCGVFSSSPLLQPFKNEAQANLRLLLKQKQPNFEAIHNELWIVKQTKGSLDSDDTCSYLKKAKVTDIPSSREVYYLLKALKQIDGCKYSDMDLPQPSVSVSDDLTDFYYNGLLGLELNKTVLCGKIDNFLGKDGAAKLRKNKQEDNYQKASQLYHFALECIKHEKNTTLSQNVIQVIRLPIQTALINIQEVFADTRSFLEREDSISSTARFLSVFLEMLPYLGKLDAVAKKEFEDFLIQDTVINLLGGSLQNVYLQSEERYWVLHSLTRDYLKDLVIPVVSKSINFPSKSVQIQVSFSNIFGDVIAAPTSIIGTLSSKENKLQQNVTLQLGKNKVKDTGYFELSSDSTFKIGQYGFQLQTKNGLMNYKFQSFIQIGTRCKISDFNFAIVQGQNSKPNFVNQVEEKELFPRTLDANEHSFLHVIFKIMFEKDLSIMPQQVAIRLAHPLYPTASFFVQATYDSRRELFYGLVDFGDPEHILPINGLYGVELLIGDQRLVENKRWKFAQIEVSFEISSKNGPTSEIDYASPELIIHRFEPPGAEIPFIFVSFFLGVIVCAFLFYLVTLKKMGVNTDKLPKSCVQQIIFFAFFGIIIAIFGVLGLFWVYFNIIETVTILSIAMVPLFLVGNFALLSLK